MPKIIWLSYISLLILGWLDVFRSPFYPDIIQSLNLSAAQGSMFFAVVSLVAFVSCYFASHWLKRVSSLVVLQLSLVLLGVGYFLISWSPNFLTLIFYCAIFGLAFGTLTFMQNIIVHQYAPAAYRRRVFTGLHTMYGIAAFLAPLSASLFVEAGFGWRGAFAILSVVPVAISAVSRRLVMAPSLAISDDAEIDLIPLPKRALWLTGLGVAFYLFGEISVSTRLVLLLRGNYSVAIPTANLCLAVFFAGLVGGRLLFSIWDLKFSSRKILLFSAGLSSLMLILAQIHHPYWMAVSGITMGPFYPVAMSHLAELFGPRHAAKSLSFGIALGLLSSGVLQITLGLLTDAFGLPLALWLAPAGLALTTLLLFFQRRLSH